MAQSRSESTKSSLIKAAFTFFADKGYAATSTREIAAAAKTNIASINYHFGGKSGLRIACAEAITEKMNRIRNDPDNLVLPTTIERPQTMFEALALRQAYMLLRLEEAAPMIRFLFREAHEQSEAFELIYQSFFNPTFEFLLIHWADATGKDPAAAKTEQARLFVFSVISQIAYFRIGQPVIARHLNWQGYSEEEAAKILTVLQSNIRAMIANQRSTP